jgi:hypothetical protein
VYVVPADRATFFEPGNETNVSSVAILGYD